MSMPFVESQIITAGDVSEATVTSAVREKRQTHHVAVEVVISGGGSPVGTLTLEGSVTGSNFVALSTQAVTADGTYLFDLPFVAARYIRLVYTKTSGTGAINAYYFSQA